MRTDFWRVAKLLLVQLLKLDINEQHVREFDYRMAGNQVPKSQITTKRQLSVLTTKFPQTWTLLTPKATSLREGQGHRDLNEIRFL